MNQYRWVLSNGTSASSDMSFGWNSTYTTSYISTAPAAVVVPVEPAPAHRTEVERLLADVEEVCSLGRVAA